MFDNLPPNETMWSYNCLDTVYTREVGETSTSAILQSGLSAANDFQHAIFPAVLYAMVRGVRIDQAARRSMRDEIRREILHREELNRRVTGFDLNPRSPKQMQAFFYSDLGLPIHWKKNEAGGRSPTLDDGALESLALKEPLIRPIVKRMQELRSLGVFRSTFLGDSKRAAGEERLTDDDGRMRCSYNICGTESFRLSSRKNAFGTGTNLQNIPKGGEDDDSGLTLPNIRKIFVPDPDHTWFDIDLSKADLRVVVWESSCKEMKSMLAEGRDPYVETAREFYRDPSISKVKADGSENPKYRMFKSFCHGTHYLGTPSGLSQRLGLTVQEATRTQQWYLGKYPEIRTWQTTFTNEIKRTHCVRNKFGFVRHYLGRIDDSTFREAIAWLPQSTVGLLINHIWLALYNHSRSQPGVEVLLQVHDSLAGQFQTAQAAAHLADIHRLAAVPIPYEDPLIIPVGVKTSESSWGSCE